jgi:hypothetical protein
MPEFPLRGSGRGERREFEPGSRLIMPITAIFDGPTEPLIVTVEHFVWSSA